MESENRRLQDNILSAGDKRAENVGRQLSTLDSTKCETLISMTLPEDERSQLGPTGNHTQ